MSTTIKTLSILRHGCAGSGRGRLILDALRELEGKLNLVYLLIILPGKTFAVAGQVFGEATKRKQQFLIAMEQDKQIV